LAAGVTGSAAGDLLKASGELSQQSEIIGIEVNNFLEEVK
jgi:hypothetical protein